MTDKKPSYIECLYHTSKKVYKYWLAFLAAIGVIIGLWFVISNAWDQIVGGFKYVERGVEYIWGGLDFIATTIGGAINQILFAVFTIQWDWWVGIGVIVGPFILVAIYCVLKRFGFDTDDVGIAIVILTLLLSLVVGMGRYG